MRLFVAILAAAAAAAAAAFPSGASPASVQAAFEADGYKIVDKAEHNSGWGLTAESINVTLYTTKAPKRVYYVAGGAADRGCVQLGALHLRQQLANHLFLHRNVFGQLSAKETYIMSEHYVNNVVPSLISPGIIQKLGNSTLAQWLLNWVGTSITKGAVKSFQEHSEQGVFPQWILDEMAGIAAGANSVLPAETQVNPDRLVTLNYGFDWISAEAFSGAIFKKLLLAADNELDTDAVQALARVMLPGSIHVPTYCDAFMVSGNATRSGSGAFMGRDLQLASGDVLQDHATMVIYAPTEAGMHPLVSVAAPGFVGSISALNSQGLSMGVDTLRAGFINITRPGLNSILMVRLATQTADSTAEATQVVRDTVRGVPYFYPMQDASGDGRVLETGMYDDGSLPDLSRLLNDTALLAALPSWEELQQLSPVDYGNGVFVRNGSYRPPQALLDTYNPKLWALSGLPYNTSAGQWGVQGALWPSFKAENEHWYNSFSRYFSPARVPLQRTDVVLVSNVALVPQLRVAEMTGWASVVPGEAMQWRYDTLARRVVTVADTVGFDLEAAQNTILFLDPWQSPGYWKVQAVPGDLNSTVIEGAISAMDCQAKVIRTKTGYFGDDWLQITLPAYL